MARDLVGRSTVLLREDQSLLQKLYIRAVYVRALYTVTRYKASLLLPQPLAQPCYRQSWHILSHQLLLRPLGGKIGLDQGRLDTSNTHSDGYNMVIRQLARLGC